MLAKKMAAFKFGSTKEQLKTLRELKKQLAREENKHLFAAALPQIVDEFKKIENTATLEEALSFMEEFSRRITETPKSKIYKEEFAVILKNKLENSITDKKIQKKAEELLTKLPHLRTISIPWGR